MAELADIRHRPSARHAGVQAIRRQAAETIAAWTLAGPAIVLMWVLLLGPAVTVILLSFTDWSLGQPSLSWVGLDNFREMAGDEVFWASFRNTLSYVAFTMPLSVFFGLGAALLIESGSSGRGFYRAIYFLPVTATLLPMAFVFQFAYFHPTVGIINHTLVALGFPTTDWLRNPDTALFALGTIGVWQSIGLNMVLFLAGLKGIPKDLYDAAALDGADGPWEQFRRVTWPMLGPATLFVLTITTIKSFQVFDTVVALTQGGPGNATNVLLFQMYQEGFSFLRSAYASALTCVFLLFVFGLTLLQVTLVGRRTHYG